MNIKTLGVISVYSGLPSDVKDAIYAIASSLGDVTLINSIAQDYVNGDAATITQVQYYIGKNTNIITQSYLGIPVWGWLVGGLIAWKLKG